MAPLLPKRKGLAVSQGALAPFLLWFPDLVDLSTVVVAPTTCSVLLVLLLLVWVSTLVQGFWVKVSTLVQIRPLGVSALVLENSPKSRLPVETSQRRLSYEAQERFSAVSRPFPPNACPQKAHQGRSLGRKRGIREPSLLADVALTEELRGSKDAGSARPEPLSSSDPARPA